MTTPWEWADAILSVAATDTDWANRGSPARMIIGNPDTDWANCCDGILSVALQRLDFAGDQWPNSGTYRPGVLSARDCADELWLAEFTVNIVRCVPVFENEQGAAPRPVDVNESAQFLLEDVHALWRALRAYPWHQRYGRAVVYGWTPLSRQGGCAGFQIRMVTKVVDRDPC
jgi:hypothetical protein